MTGCSMRFAPSRWRRSKIRAKWRTAVSDSRKLQVGSVSAVLTRRRRRRPTTYGVTHHRRSQPSNGHRARSSRPPRRRMQSWQECRVTFPRAVVTAVLSFAGGPRGLTSPAFGSPPAEHKGKPPWDSPNKLHTRTGSQNWLAYDPAIDDRALAESSI